MSNFKAIATVTVALRYRLQAAANLAVSEAIVTTRRPEAVHDGGQNKASVNIFLYMVSPNAAWRNTDLELRYSPSKEYPTGSIEKRPLAPLNLSYLFSFYGNELTLEPQRLLGSVIRDLHDRPRLSADDIRAAVEGEKGYSDLGDSGLDDQVERIEYITLTPTGLNLEELSKLWSVFFQVPYALSVAYTASTVLIESGVAAMHKAIEERRINVMPEVPSSEKSSPEVKA